MKFSEKSKENKKIKMGEENNQFIFFYLNKELKYIEILNLLKLDLEQCQSCSF